MRNILLSRFALITFNIFYFHLKEECFSYRDILLAEVIHQRLQQQSAERNKHDSFSKHFQHKEVPGLNIKNAQ